MTQVRLKVENEWVVGEDHVSMMHMTRDGRTIFASAEVGTGVYPATPPPRPVTGREGLRAILAEINNAPDPFAEAGLWLTHLTNVITKIIREDDQK